MCIKNQYNCVVAHLLFFSEGGFLDLYIVVGTEWFVFFCLDAGTLCTAVLN